MCGIVGYVGQQNAVDVVHRGAPTSGVPRLRQRRGRGGRADEVAGASTGRQARQPREAAGRAAAAGDDVRHGPHPLGHARRTDRPQRAPAPRRGGQGRGGAQRHHRELRRAPRRARGVGRDAGVRHRHRGRLAPAGRVPSTATWPRRCARCAVGSTVPSRWSPSMPTSRTSSSGHVATHRWSSAGVTARTSSAATSRRSSRTPVVPSSSARTRSSSCAPTASTSRLRRSARPTVKEYEVDWDASAAEKGGYDYFMLKEIYEQPKAVADTLLGRIDDDGLLQLDEMRLSDDDLRDIDKIVIIACGTAYHAGLIAKYSIEHWTRIPVEVEVASEFRYRDPILDPPDARHRDLAVRRDDGHVDGDPPCARAGVAGARRSATSTGRPSRASPTPWSTPTPGPRSPSPRRRPSSPRSSPCTWSRCTSRRCAAPSGATRSPATSHELAAMPEAVDRVLDTVEPVRALARELVDAKAVLFLGRHVGYPVALEGALKLKELAYMHAEGFPAGELKHGPIALIEEGLPVVVIVPPRSRRGPARQDREQHPGDPGPRRAHDRDRRGGRRDGDAVRRHPHPRPVPCRRCCSRSSRPFRCRCSPASWPAPRATTSTSRATWPSPSRWSDTRLLQGTARPGAGSDCVPGDRGTSGSTS